MHKGLGFNPQTLNRGGEGPWLHLEGPEVDDLSGRPEPEVGSRPQLHDLPLELSAARDQGSSRL